MGNLVSENINGVKGMGDDSKLFEQVVAYLFRANHNVMIECDYKGKTRLRQFDGYYEELLGDFKIEMKIGIECRKRRGKVRIRDVEAFSKTIERCGIDKGIIVSFSGFQAGALDEAKLSRIDLFEFRPCVESDFKKGSKVVDYQPIKPGYWRVSAEITGEFNQDSDPEKELTEITSSFSGFHNIDVFDEKGIIVGRLDDMISSMINREWLRGIQDGTLNIDWSSVKLYIHSTRAKKVFAARVLSLEVDFQLPDIRKRTREFKHDEWYLMKDIIQETHRLIPFSQVREIEDLYRK